MEFIAFYLYTVVCWYVRPCQELQLTIEWVTRSIAIELLTTNCAPPGTEFYNQKPSVLFIIYNKRKTGRSDTIHLCLYGRTFRQIIVTSSGFFFITVCYYYYIFFFCEMRFKWVVHMNVLYCEFKLRNAKELETIGATNAITLLWINITFIVLHCSFYYFNLNMQFLFDL
jgi:hypothetical protein